MMFITKISLGIIIIIIIIITTTIKLRRIIRDTEMCGFKVTC